MLVVGVAATPWGRGKVAQLIASQVSDAIAGSMTIDEATAFDGTTLSVRGLRFTDPRGDEVITIAEATVHADWSRLLDGVMRLDRASARDADVIVGPYDEHYSTSIEAAFGDPAGPDAPAGEDPMRVLLDAVELNDVRVKLRWDPRPTIRVSRGVLRLDHRGSAAPADARPTEVDLSGVVAIAFFRDRPILNATPLRAAGSVFNLRIRVCHPRDELALGLVIPPGEPVRLIYDHESLVFRIALGFVRLISGMSLRPGDVSLDGVGGC